MNNIDVVILAAGKGTRMHSDQPKVLHLLAGKPLLEHVINTAKTVNGKGIYIVYGYCGEEVHQSLEHLDVKWVEQKEQLGTGHAVMQALPQLESDGRVLVLYGDVPLLSEKTVARLVETTPENAIGWLTAVVPDPRGLGRIIRDKNEEPIAIVEEKDATQAQKNIHEINTGICLVPTKYLKEWLGDLKNSNVQSEYYLTDIFEKAAKNNIPINISFPERHQEVLGINDCSQLAYLERVYQHQRAIEFMRQGLTLLDPDRFDIRGELVFGKDNTIDVNVVMEGSITIGSNCYIGPNVILKNVNIADNVEIKANSIVEDAVVESDCVVGPFARVRPGTKLRRKAKIGNFVEIKKSEIKEGSKINHLTYIGDATIGKNVNVGAGTITCNYNGVHKYKTIIGDNVFVGSNVQFVAPVTIGENATIGAGSTITKNVPPNKLVLARSKQTVVENWQRPKKEEK